MHFFFKKKKVDEGNEEMVVNGEEIFEWRSRADIRWGSSQRIPKDWTRNWSGQKALSGQKLIQRLPFIM